MADVTPVTLVTGFLGAGKTTLLNRILHDPALRDTAVIVNEFGEIGLDHALVEGGNDEILLLDAGCLCCVLADSLRETLVDLFQRRATGILPPFQRVIIETSGLADPAPVLESLIRDPLLIGRFGLGPVLCVVDAVFGLRTLAEHCEARAQVAMADRLLVAKGPSTVGLTSALRDINPVAAIETTADIADPSAMLDAPHAWNSVKPDGPRHNFDIGAYSFRRARAARWEGVAAWTGHLTARWGDAILRCKALVEVAGLEGPALIQGVRNRFAVTRLASWPDAERGGRYVIIGSGLNPAELDGGLAWLNCTEKAEGPDLAGLPKMDENES